MAPQLVPTVPLAVMRSAASSLSSSSSPTPPEPLYTTTVVEIVYASPTAQLSSSSKAGSIASAAAALAQGDIAGGQDVNGYLSFAELGAIITSLFLATLLLTIMASFVLAQARNARRLAEGRSTDLEWFGLGRSRPKEGKGRMAARAKGEAEGEQAGLMTRSTMDSSSSDSGDSDENLRGRA